MSVEKTVKEMNAKLDEHIASSIEQNVRLEGLETSMGKLTDAVVQIARAEEKISTLVDDSKEIKADIRESKERLYEVERDVAQNTKDLEGYNKVVWRVASAVITVIVGALAAVTILPQ